MTEDAARAQATQDTAWDLGGPMVVPAEGNWVWEAKCSWQEVSELPL